jgi:hypothetical protein
MCTNIGGYCAGPMGAGLLPLTGVAGMFAAVPEVTAMIVPGRIGNTGAGLGLGGSGGGGGAAGAPAVG